MLKSQNIKVSKYIFKDILNAMKYYYAIIAIISLFFMWIFTYSNASGGKVNGFGVSALIFLFFTGRGFFRSSFGFTQANNVSRRSFYHGGILGLLAAAGVMAALEVILNNALKLLMPYEGLVEMMYIRNDIIADYVWSFASFSLFLSIGWFVGMVLYRVKGKQRTLVMVAPFLTIVVLGFIDQTFGLNIFGSLFSFLLKALGLTNLNPFIAAMNLMLACIIVLALCFPIIRKIPLRG